VGDTERQAILDLIDEKMFGHDEMTAILPSKMTRT
jgi:hypothetical protein